MKTCLLICAPKLSETADFVRPLSRTDFFHEALNAPHMGIELLHPTAVGAASFPVWLDQVAGGTQASVPDKRLQNVFQSPSRNQGLLFLKAPARSDVRLTFEGARYHYAGLEAADVNHPDSLVFRAGGGNLRRRLLRETRRAGDELTHWQIGVARRERSPEAWMNPLVLRIQLDGTSCAVPPADALPSDTRVAFAQLMQHTDVLALIPGFEPADDVRCRAWRAILQRASDDPSAIERLVLGDGSARRADKEEDVAWAFTALDALKGTFSIEGHGDPSPRARLKYTWHPHPRAAPNTLWFGSQLVARWGRGHSLVPTQTSPTDRPSELSSRCSFATAPLERSEIPRARILSQQDVLSFPQRIFALAPRQFSPVELQAATQSLPEYLRLCAGWQAELSTQTTLDFFQVLLEDLLLHRVPFEQRMHRRWFRLVDNQRLATDVPALLDDLARALVVPRSPVLIRLPKPTADSSTAYVDVIAAVPGGARALVWSLLRERPTPQRERAIALTMGWWNTWHSSLFDDPADVKLHFRNTTFELGAAVLGKIALGGAANTKLEETTPVRFSVPL